MGTPILRITSASNENINLLGSVFFLNATRPQIAQYKNGGAYVSSSFADGRRLVDTKYANVIETYDIKIASHSQDAIAASMQAVRKILIKAVQYWTTAWQSEPVWIEAKSANETNTRYAVIHNGTIAEDENLWHTPFIQPLGNALMDNINLIIERGHWLASQPGVGTATELSAVETYEVGAARNSSSPQVSGDDCVFTFVNAGPDTIALAGTTGQVGCSFSCGAGNEENENPGFRFRGINIAQGTQITSAILRVIASANTANYVDVDIYGDDVDSAAIFTTAADYLGRTLTSAFTNWVPAAFVTDTVMSIDVTDVVQEILDRGAWAAGNDLALLMLAWPGGASTGVGNIYLWDHATTTNRPKLEIVI